MDDPISSEPARLSIATRGIAALLAALALNVLIRVVATELLGVDSTYEHLAWRDFISTTAGVVFLAVIFRIALGRFTARAAAIFTRVAVAVFAVSLLGPLSLLANDEAADGGVVAALTLMHVATALVVLKLLTVPSIEAKQALPSESGLRPSA